MKRFVLAALTALALGAVTAPEGQASGRLVRCRIESGGRVEHSGQCRFIADADGSFSLENSHGDEPLFDDILDVSVSIVARDAAEVRGLTRWGNNSRWGEARRSASDRACWNGADFRVCAY
jgi:hypothetical protein